MCDKLVRAVRFRTPLWQIRTLERSLAVGRIVRIQFADGRQTFHNRAPNSRIRLDANPIIDG
jgi:hypothetical protein